MIESNELGKTYKLKHGTRVGIENVKLSFRDRELVAILGPSGSGKTTLLNLIGGLDNATTGEITVDSTNMSDFKGRDWNTYRAKRIGFVFQDYHLIPHQTVLENVELALKLGGEKRETSAEQAKDMLERLGLGDFLNDLPGQLSEGQRQLVAIARALVGDPDIVLADEPTVALDEDAEAEVMNLLKELSESRLVIVATHYPELAEEHADRVIRLDEGRAIEDSNPFEPATAPLVAAADIAAPVRTSTRPATTIGLSFKNLGTKKWRTFATAFAASIGIIGISLILALSNGINGHIRQAENEVLATHPLTIGKTEVDISSMLGSDQQTGTDNSSSSATLMSGDLTQTTNVSMENVLNDMVASVKNNDLGSFKQYLEKNSNEVSKYAESVEYDYGIAPEIYSSNPNYSYVSLNPSPLSSIASSLLGTSTALTSAFNELPRETSRIEEGTELVRGRLPQNSSEAVLVLSPSGQISDYTLYSLGYYDAEIEKQITDALVNGQSFDMSTINKPFTYNDALALSFKVVNPTSHYTRNPEGGWTDISLDPSVATQLAANSTKELKVVGIIKPDSNASSVFSEGIAYTHELTEEVMTEASNSEIVKEQIANPTIDVFTGKPFEQLKSETDKELDLGLANLISVEPERMLGAFSYDVNVLDKLDLGEVKDLDLSSFENVVTKDMVRDFLGKFPLPDLSSIDPNLSASNAAAVDAIGKQVAEGFLPYWYKQHPGEAITEDTEFVSDASTYLASNEVSTLIEGAVGIMGEDYRDKITNFLTDYLYDQLAPYLGSAFDTVVDRTVNEALPPVTDQITTGIDSMLNRLFSTETLGTLASGVQFDDAQFKDSIHFNMTWSDLSNIINTFRKAEDLNRDANLKVLGYALPENPKSVSIYCTTFEDKEAVLDIIDGYNKQVSDAGTPDKAITYSDVLGTILGALSSIIDKLALVFITFVAISLIVSSLMIGVLTYASTRERTREIGILRALGASRSTIAGIFNSENLIQGFLAGIIAVFVALLLTIPLNSYIETNYHLSTLLILHPLQALGLVAVVSQKLV